MRIALARPDVAFTAVRTAVFVHGCFWHRHPGCRYAYNPKSNVQTWRTKFDTNVARDARVGSELDQSGWGVLTIWECETADLEMLANKLTRFLNDVDG